MSIGAENDLSSFRCYNCGAQYDQKVEYCLGCSSFRCVLPAMRRPADQMWASAPKVMSATQLMRERHSHWTSTSYPDIVFGPSALIGVYGPPGGGKSTMATQWLDGLDGPVLYWSAEEGVGDTMASRLRRLEVVRDDFFCAEIRMLDEIDSIIADHSPIAIVVDSVNVLTLQPTDLVRLVNDKGIVCLFVMQSTKGGGFAGVQSWGHVSDVMIRVEGLSWQMEKSRYSDLKTGGVLHGTTNV